GSAQSRTGLQTARILATRNTVPGMTFRPRGRCKYAARQKIQKSRRTFATGGESNSGALKPLKQTETRRKGLSCRVCLLFMGCVWACGGAHAAKVDAR